MYLNYFGLVERPFSIAPDPQYLYMSQRHREAMAHLSYGLSQGGCFIVLTGEVGTGKTTLCRNLLADLPDNVDVALILNPSINRRELLETVCDELKIATTAKQSKKAMLDLINEHLLSAFAENRHTVLIIDEAQLLSRDVLEQVRLLTNLETTKSKLLQIILIGQPELNDLLTRDDLRQLAQRVTARYHLPAIGPDEIQDYVNFRLGVAGCKKPLFSAQALKLLHKLTDGIPRKINVLADHALLGTYSKSQVLVDAKTLRQSAKDVFITSNSESKLKIKPAWIGALAVALLMNIGLWWWFSGDRSEPVMTAQVSGGALADQVKGAGVGAEAVSLSESVASESAAEGSLSSAEGSPSENSATLIDVSELSASDSAVTSIEKPEGVTPGSVVIADEFLDADAPPEQPSSTGGTASGPAVVVSSEPLVPPKYLESSAFGRVLDVSADRTGRVATFRNLASAWDVDLPDQLLGPLCQELSEQKVECLAVANWAKLLRLNRPTIMVLSHKDVLHRVILYQLENEVASVLVGEQSYELPVSELRDRWGDDATVFWRPSELGVDFLQPGYLGPKVTQVRVALNKLFAQLDLPLLADSESPFFDNELAARIKQLQQRAGIVADGKIGQETYLLINELLDTQNVPVLQRRG